MTQPLLTAAQLAEQLGVTTATILSWARTGKIPCLRPTPRIVRFDLEAVIEKLMPSTVARGGEDEE